MRISLQLVLCLFLLSGCNDGAGLGTEIGKKAPEITSEDMTGKPLTLSQFQGKVVLIDFWATWCPPCMNEIVHERDLHRQFDGHAFVILGISRDRNRDELKRYLDSAKLPWPNIYDSTGNIADQWKVSNLPTFVLVDHNGVIVDRWEGGGQIEKIRQAVDKAVRAAEKK